jgi:PilZ domain
MARFESESTNTATEFGVAVEAAFASQETTYKISDYFPERRRHTRFPVRLRADARRLDNASYAQRAPKVALTILDISEGGLRATSRMPVLAGERLAVSMPPESGLPGRIFGKVIRCSPRKDGYALAIKFDYVPAA